MNIRKYQDILRLEGLGRLEPFEGESTDNPYDKEDILYDGGTGEVVGRVASKQMLDRARLTPKQRDTLLKIYGFTGDGPRTMRELSEDEEVSSTAISLRLGRALEILKSLGPTKDFEITERLNSQRGIRESARGLEEFHDAVGATREEQEEERHRRLHGSTDTFIPPPPTPEDTASYTKEKQNLGSVAGWLRKLINSLRRDS